MLYRTPARPAHSAVSGEDTARELAVIPVLTEKTSTPNNLFVIFTI